MSSILDNVQPAVKKETKRVVKITAVGLILMWILFAVLHFTMPDKVPLDYTVFLGGIGGGAVRSRLYADRRALRAGRGRYAAAGRFLSPAEP